MEASVFETIARISVRERLLIASSRGMPMDGSSDKVAALADVAQALDRVGATYAVVGGVAVGIRSGVPRATIGIDIAVRSTVEGTRRSSHLVRHQMQEIRENAPLARLTPSWHRG
jgi:hypothetical protein